MDIENLRYTTNDQLIEFFKKKPYAPDYLNHCACTGFAKLIFHELGGSKYARIFWIEELDEHPNERRLELSCHAYVILMRDELDMPAFNNLRDLVAKPATKGEILLYGTDVTEEFLNYTWEECGCQCYPEE